MPLGGTAVYVGETGAEVLLENLLVADNGTANDDYANLAWLARGDFRSEFVAMIPANTPWARGKRKP